MATGQVLWYNPRANNGAGSFQDYANLSTPRFGAGRGYFINLHYSTSQNYDAAIALRNGKSKLNDLTLNRHHYVPVHMTTGYNTIGIPGDQPITFNQDIIRVRTGNRNGIAQEKTYREASAGPNPWVHPFPSRWNPNTKAYEHVNDGDIIYPSQGMMLYVCPKDGDPDVELLIPNYNPGRSASPEVLPSATMQWAANTLPSQVGSVQVDRIAIDGNYPAGFMQYGPYTDEVPVGNNVAEWEMQITDMPQGGNAICRIDVWDATTGTLIAYKDLYRSDWSATYTFEKKTLAFSIGADRAGHLFEFRTHWNAIGNAPYLAVQTVRLKHY